MKIAYVRTGGRGVQTNAYALRTGGRGVKNWQIFAYVLYGWPLAEIQYPHTWETFTKEDYRFQIRIGDEIIPISVSAGYYKDTGQLVTEINKRIKEAFTEISTFVNFCITFKYSSLSQKTKFILKDGCSIISIKD